MRILIRGRPGVGKTTLIKKLVSEIDQPKTGFYTEEIRIGKVRTGFRFIALRGEEGVLARTDFADPLRVGRYRVSLDQFEQVVLPSIETGIKNRWLIIIDEIGKMELLSLRFQTTL